MKGRQIRYSAEELAWIEERREWPREIMQRTFNILFDRDVSLSNINALCKRKGWMTGRSGCFVKGQTPANKGKKMPEGVGGRHPNARRTQFRKGGLPHNTKHLGHERVSKDGYVEISVAETNPHTGYERRYVHKHVWLWEKVNGPVPEGHCLKCIDGDKANTDPSNWTLIPRGVLARLNGGRHKRRLGYDEAPGELKPTLMVLAKVEHAAHLRRTA